MSRILPHLRPWSFVVWVVACTGTPEIAPAPSGGEVPEAPGSNPELPALDLAGLKGAAEEVALVPSPVETQRALQASGIETQLASLIPDHGFDASATGADRVALRTGVVLADLLLTVKTADKADLIGRIASIRAGMQQLGGGESIDAVLSQMHDRVTADAVTRDELLQEFDELSGSAIPKLGFGGDARVLPLLQAGSWLEGANLVSRALQGVGEPERSAASQLLKAPGVVDYFVRYVAKESAGAPEAVTQKLEASLGVLQTLSAKPQPLTAEDLAEITRVTGEVLSLL